MKKIVFLVILAGLAGSVWYVWRKPARQEEEEAKPATEVPIRIGQLARVTLHRYCTAYGVVEAEPPGERPAASARLAPNVAGVVAAVACADGQRVEKGALLFQMDSRAVDVAADKARAGMVFAEKNLDRQKKLIQVDGTSQKLLLEAEQALTSARLDLAAAQTQQALLCIQAPISGIITRIQAKPGEAVDLTTVLAEITDPDRLVASASVPSSELAGLKAGLPVIVTADKSPSLTKCTLVYVSPQVDAKTGTALVRAGLPARAGLVPGQWVMLQIVIEEHADRLAAPSESVVKDAEGNTVIAVVKDHQAVQKAVKAGLRDGDLTEIEGEGLQAGLTVVTEGAYALPKETKVRILEK